MKKLIYLLPLLFALLISCKAPEGPQGPQGPKGEQGAQGPPGQDGQDGTDGQDGSANVTTRIGIWNQNDVQFNSDSSFAYVTFEIEELTSEAVNNAAVMGYYNQTLGSVEGWTALPINGPYMEYTYTYAEGIFEVDMIPTYYNKVYEDDIIEGRVKIVIIPPTSSPKVKPEDWNNRVKEPGLLSNKY